MSVLSKPYFHDEAEAFRFVETTLWPLGPACPHCGCAGRIYPLANVRTKASKKNPEGVVRHGLKKCGDCRKQFTVRMGTIFEESHLPLTKWLQAIFLMSSSKKGVSAHQLHRTLEVTYKTAWFLAHRIREAMRSGDLAPFGSDGGVVEVDETFIGREPGMAVRGGYAHKMKVLTLLERNTGRAKSIVIDDLKAETIAPILRENIAKEAFMITDEAHRFKRVGKEFANHESVNHARDEYVRYGTPLITTNTIEGYFSVFKRGMKGTYQHCAKHHLHRYMAEFDFRYTERSALGVDDIQRAEIALKGTVGKRLTYRNPNAEI